jgi:hypothetical protein
MKVGVARHLFSGADNIIECLGWDSKAYSYAVRNQDGSKASFEDALKMNFPPLKNGENKPISVDRPITVADREGHVQFWYAPNVLTPERQVCGI